MVEIKDDARKVFIAASSYRRASERARELGLNPHSGGPAWIYYDSIDRARGYHSSLLLVDDQTPQKADEIYLRDNGWEIRYMHDVHAQPVADPWADRREDVRHFGAVLRPNPNLPEHLRTISDHCYALALYLLERCEDGYELVEALEHIRRAKDSAVMQAVLDRS